MQHDRQLAWVTRNRARPERARQAGASVLLLVDGALKPAAGERARLLATLADHVDEDFGRHCRLGDVRGGAVVIHVDEPGLVSAMRRQWIARLESAARKYRGAQAVHRVVFEFGRSGAPIWRGQTK